MKITNVDKETKKSKMQQLLPIAQAGLGLGLTAFLIHSGVVNYDQMINWETTTAFLENYTNMMENIPLPFLNTTAEATNGMVNLVKAGITTLGMNNFILASKSFSFIKSIATPILESEKFQNNKIIHKIKDITKANRLDKTDITEKTDSEEKHPKLNRALRIATTGLATAFKLNFILSGSIDYNQTYDFTKLPHKFAKLAEFAETIDLNKVKAGILLGKAANDIIQDKRAELPKVSFPKTISFKDILKNISKDTQLPTMSNIDAIRKSFPGKQEELLLEGEK